MSAEEEVRAAHEVFYQRLSALLHGAGVDQLMEIWLQDDTITTGQPIESWARGLTKVRASWAGMDALTLVGSVTVDDLSIHVHGAMAYTLGVEHATFIVNGKPYAFVAETTNIYKNVEGKWLMVHHHVNAQHR